MVFAAIYLGVIIHVIIKFNPMLQKSAVTTFLFFLLGPILAQTVPQVQGNITDINGRPIANASVSLFKDSDTSFAQKTVCDSNGMFQFLHIPDGSYFLSITTIGFSKTASAGFRIDKGMTAAHVVNLTLLPRGNIMDAVVVKASRPLIENRIDGMAVNVDAFMNNAGNSILDVIGLSPSVDLDINGTISIKGKSGASIFIEGKKSYLSGTDLTNYLKSIPASQVDQIEIMTQPSAKYDVAGNSGVINIKLKKTRQSGLNINLSLNYTQGVYAKSSNSFMINYKKDKWNFSCNLGYEYFTNITTRHLYRIIADTSASSKTLFDQNNDDLQKIPGFNLLAGIDYEAGKKWTLGFTLGTKLSRYHDNFSSLSTFEDENNSNKLLSSAKGLNHFLRPWVNTGIGLNLRHIVDQKQELELNLNYEYYDLNASQQSINYTYDSAGRIENNRSQENPYIQRADLPSLIRIYAAKADYSRTLTTKAKLEAGWKSSFIQSTNQSSFYNLQNDSMNLDLDLTNKYDYNENINALYLNYHQQLGKWEFQAGLRWEGTYTRGQQEVGHQNSDKQYSRLFPTLFLGYSPGRRHIFSLSYGKRLDRPDYIDLNPFVYIIDPYTYRKGNPNLQPYFTDNIELSYNFKGKLNVSANYTKATNTINDIIIQNDSTKILLQTRQNLGSYTNIGLSLSYNTAITKWYYLIFSYNLFNNHYKGSILTGTVDQRLTTAQFNLIQQFHFNPGWSAEIQLFYRSRFLFPALYIRGPRNMNSLAIGKDLLKNKVNIKLRIADPFYIQRSSVSTYFQNINTKTDFREDSRRIALTLTYRFQKGIKNSSRKTYNPEEINRINVN
jgi:outer membrane receptor protein involved in Fe transport